MSVFKSDKGPNFVWLAAHGYGQLAAKFVYKFSELPDDHHVYAPEGLSRFYWQGTDGEAVASWMTRIHREEEIADQMFFLDRLYNEHIAAEVEAGARLILFGFSQGGTTIWRWIDHSRVDFYALINWANWPPEDVDYTSMAEYLRGRRLIYVLGKRDPYITPVREALLQERIQSWPFRCEEISFPGGHEIDRKVLLRLAESLG